jgi:hypothetical protein
MSRSSTFFSGSCNSMTGIVTEQKSGMKQTNIRVSETLLRFSGICDLLELDHRSCSSSYRLSIDRAPTFFPYTKLTCFFSFFRLLDPSLLNLRSRSCCYRMREAIGGLYEERVGMYASYVPYVPYLSSSSFQKSGSRVFGIIGRSRQIDVSQIT